MIVDWLEVAVFGFSTMRPSIEKIENGSVSLGDDKGDLVLDNRGASEGNSCSEAPDCSEVFSVK